MTTDILISLDQDEVLTYLSQMKTFIDSADFSDWTLFNSAKRTFLNNFKTYQAVDKQKIWKEFTEVADSGRAIKKRQEEEGEFAAEMIAKALDAHEIELSSQGVFTFSHALLDKVAAFKGVRDELKTHLSRVRFLSSKGDQLQALRQELAKTGMRLSVKGKLFDRFSKLGDAVFPVKKELGKKIIESFNQGLDNFVKSSLKRDDGDEMLFEIRVIQSFLKEMALKKADYDAIKAIIDPLWKKAVILKDKKESQAQEVLAKSNQLKESLSQEFNAMKALVEEGKDQEALKLYDAIALKMKDRSLQKNDYKQLKSELDLASRPIFDRLKEQKELKLEQQKQQASMQEEQKQKYCDQLNPDVSLEERKIALSSLLGLNLNVAEVYRFKLKFISSQFVDAASSQELQALYLDAKKLQEAIRGSIASSGMDLSIGMALHECFDEVKQLLNEILKKVD